MKTIHKPVNALAVANYFLEKGWKQGIPISPLKLQKLVYFAHGWWLGLTGRPLIDAPILAWTYGPVIPELYDEFRRFGSDPIVDRATVVNTNLQLEPASLTPEQRAELTPLLDKIWETYGKYSAIQLSNMTHQAGTPWAKVRQLSDQSSRYQTEIPNELIRENFAERNR
jgi:uncharacterized phage-associated protein